MLQLHVLAMQCRPRLQIHVQGTPPPAEAHKRGGNSQRRRAGESLEMDARPRQTPAALPLLLMFPMFSGSQVSGYGDDLGVGGMTTLQKHATFFDGDKDGVVTFSEAYEEKLNTLKDQLRGLEASLAEATSTQLRKESECKLTSESIPNDTATNELCAPCSKADAGILRFVIWF